MNKLLLVLSLFVLYSCCGTKAQAIEDSKLQEQEKRQYVIEYSALTRGAYKRIVLEGDLLTVQLDRAQEPKVVTCTSQELSSIYDFVAKLELNELQNLEVPSKAHQYDGALIAVLKITNQGTLYHSPSFDHGNPPKEIEPLVLQLLSLAEKVE
ncbi:hypothetical protein [Mangrovimonas sp. TPBH4]|uniref:hypothetical protein n=1 Tax=Mangrovimonas sp. TPBH4 TaxID=1645914 RepID=UPI0006B5B448|nr:hypothetical protein [Mangrovimonas sp. TPBH4]